MHEVENAIDTMSRLQVMNMQELHHAGFRVDDKERERKSKQ